MTKAIRKYTVGIRIKKIEGDELTIVPYTIIDDEEKREERPVLMIVGDSFQFDYTKSVEFVDVINIDDRNGTFVRKIG